MKITKVKTKAAEIEISKTELFALRQIFNEACHGIRIDNFSETIGVCQNEAEQFFDYFNDLEKRTSPGSPIIHQVISEKPKSNQKGKEAIRKKCCLCSEDYNLCFYIRELDWTNIELGLVVTLEREDLLFARTDANRISIEKLRQETILLKEGTNSYSFSQKIDFHTNYSFFNKIVHFNLSTTELNNSESLNESQLAIEFIFEPRKKIDAFNTPTLNSSNTTKSFTSVTTLDNITRFVAEVEDFLKSIIDPVAPGGGTAFKPKSRKKYFDNLR